MKAVWEPNGVVAQRKEIDRMKITVAGVGYVGLSLAVLLAQHHEVTAITTTEAKAEKLNRFISHNHACFYRYEA